MTGEGREITPLDLRPRLPCFLGMEEGYQTILNKDTVVGSECRDWRNEPEGQHVKASARCWNVLGVRLVWLLMEVDLVVLMEI